MFGDGRKSGKACGKPETTSRLQNLPTDVMYKKGARDKVSTRRCAECIVNEETP